MAATNSPGVDFAQRPRASVVAPNRREEADLARQLDVQSLAAFAPPVAAPWRKPPKRPAFSRCAPWHRDCCPGGSRHDLLLVTVRPPPGLMVMPPRRPGGFVF